MRVRLHRSPSAASAVLVSRPAARALVRALDGGVGVARLRPGAAVTRLPMPPGTLASVCFCERGFASARRPLSPATSTVNGSAHGADVWERLRWGDEWLDGAVEGGMFGCGLYLHVRALLAGEAEDGERVVYRVRSRLIPGRRVLLSDGDATARAIVTTVGLARDPQGVGGWAWSIGLRATWR